MSNECKVRVQQSYLVTEIKGKFPIRDHASYLNSGHIMGALINLQQMVTLRILASISYI